MLAVSQVTTKKSLAHRGNRRPESVAASIDYDPRMNYDAVLFDAAETLFTTRGSVGAIYSSVARKFGSTASASRYRKPSSATSTTPAL